jgi:hypothetical protein
VKSIGRCRAGAASAILLALLAGCGGGDAGSDGGGGNGGNGGSGGAGGGSIVDGSQCTATIQNHADEGAMHVTCTTPTSYGSSPPSSGNHYPKWAAFQTYTSPVPWGNLVHAMEHGAVVIVYNCPEGCATEVAQAQAFIDATVDPLCGAARRMILAPDPTLDVRWAAAAWTWTLRAECFEEAAFRMFVEQHLGNGLEAICAGGYTELCP